MPIAHDSNDTHASIRAHAAAPSLLANDPAVPKLCVQTIEAGASIEPHVHHDADELVYVFDGELNVHLGKREAKLRAGMSAALPRGLRHAFDNVGDHPARMLVVLAHGEGGRFLDALAQAHSRLPEDAARVAALLVQREMYVVT
jgi:quercetin dioxygenase-like cupin family protein